MKRMTLIQLGALVALVVFGAYHGARAQQPAPQPPCAAGADASAAQEGCTL
ncbi:hypothetical protein PVT71_13905 [Salipiger sp. H15]|uniref:Uncharacterized protein n=1 Tax=Alloyangia sp. H15 TaxID=3029062 RepID=A0AAU8AGD5_9RHOB